MSKRERKPSWLKVKLPLGASYRKVKQTVDHYNLHTICQSGNCPNLGECWSTGTATFMILGNICTRSCTFCNVQTGKPTEYDTNEPRRVAEAIKLMGVKHAVITSVNRDELVDKGGQIWHNTVVEVKKINPKTTIETLIPEVKEDWFALELMISPGQEIVSHNLETVKELYKTIQPQSNPTIIEVSNNCAGLENSAKEPKVAVIASAKAPAGSPPPFGAITSQKRQWL